VFEKNFVTHSLILVINYRTVKTFSPQTESITVLSSLRAWLDRALIVAF